MNNILVKSFLSVLVLIALSGSTTSELIVEEAALEEGVMRTVSTDFGKTVKHYWHFHPVQSIAANTNGDIAAALTNNEIAIWNSATNIIKRTIAGHTSLVTSVKYFPNGNLLSGSHDSYARVWNANDSYSSKCYSFYGPEKFQKIQPLKDAYYAIAKSTSASIMTYASCYYYRHLINHTAEVLSLAHLTNDDLASGSADKTIKIWNWRDGTLKRTIAAHDGSVTALVQLPSGELASGSADKTIKIWNPNDGSRLFTLSAHTGPITALVVLPNGYLASSSLSDNTIRIWDTYRGINVYTFSGHSAGINDLALLSTGELASASIDRTVRIWTAK